MSNKAFAKSKSWELRFYRKARRGASKKNSALIKPGRPQVDRLLRKALISGGKAALFLPTR
jgi:hypothetical protein